MLVDISTVVWKEWRELVFHPASLRSTLATSFVIVLLLGIIFPVKIGPEWLSSPLYLAYWGWVPSMLVSTLIADSFAGERERHTLDTLLASRLSDLAILLGKIAASVAYSSAITFSLLVVGALSVNGIRWLGHPAFYSPEICVAAGSVTLLVAVGTAAAGALASLHAATVRQAQQTLNVVLMTTGLVPLFVAELAPAETRAAFLAWATTVERVTWLIGGVTAMVMLDGILLVAAVRRFRRAELVLD
jgi:ABC-2 type transport system permease protein